MIYLTQSPNHKPRHIEFQQLKCGDTYVLFGGITVYIVSEISNNELVGIALHSGHISMHTPYIKVVKVEIQATWVEDLE